jgi:DNA-directed RNA polymerase specialized sigma24 family protein
MTRPLSLDQLGDMEQPEPALRSEQLRELVDGLPKQHRHMVSRVYFGGAPVTDAAREIGVTQSVAKRLLREALEGLRGSLLEED